MLGRSHNRRTTDCADLNGNLSPYGSPYNALYIDDEVNRIHLLGRSTNPTVGARAHRREPWCAFKDGHAPGDKRVWRGQWDGSGNVTTCTGASRCARQAMDELTYYSAGGAPLAALSQRLVVYDLSVTSSTIRATKSGEYYEYFGGPPPRGVSARMLLKNSGGWVNQDRLGSIGKFFPYGQERPSATSDGKEKFATYFRDSETGLDYAQNRYHDPGDGRFMTADPYAGSAKAGDPGSWNRYAYVEGDPVNNNDPSGLDYMYRIYYGSGYLEDTSVDGLMGQFGCYMIYFQDLGRFYGCEFGGVGSPYFGNGPVLPYFIDWAVEASPVQSGGYAGPAPPLLSAAPTALQVKFETAWQMAWDALTTTDCARHFGDPDSSSVLARFESIQWSYGEIFNEDDTINRTNPAVAKTDGTIRLNQNEDSFFAGEDGAWDWWGNTPGPVYGTGDQWRMLLILHEFLHVVGFSSYPGKPNGPDSNGYTNSYNKGILEDCVGIK